MAPCGREWRLEENAETVEYEPKADPLRGEKLIRLIENEKAQIIS